MNRVFDKIRDFGIIPVIKLDTVEQAVPLAQALINGGLNVAEVTFRTEAAFEGIKAIKSAFPNMLVGAGTVINKDFAKKAIEAGSEFIVAPGFNPEVVDYVLAQNVAMIPGVATPSEVELALCKGLSVLKLFPAEVLGGVAMLKALNGPFPNVKFVPTGGINQENCKNYLDCKNVLAVGGSWMIKKDLQDVERLTKQAIKLVISG